MKIFKTVIVTPILAVALAACQPPVPSQTDTDTIRYGQNRVAILMERDTPPGCELWRVSKFVTNTQGVRIFENSAGIFVTVCRKDGDQANTTWTQQNGKGTSQHRSFSLTGPGF